MMRWTLAPLRVVLFLGLSAGFVTGRAPETSSDCAVFLGSGLADEDLLVFTAAVAASSHPGVVLLDAPKSSPYTKTFLTAFRPERVIPVGSFPEGIADLDRRLGVSTAPVLEWARGPPVELWKTLFPKADRVVVCPAEPRRLLLQAACLAGALQAPLFVTHGQPDEAAELRRRLTEWRAREVFAAGTAAQLCRDLPETRLTTLADEAAVAASYLRQQRQRGPIHSLVIANPADTCKGLGGMSVLAPWLALQKRAALLLTNDAGDNVAAVVRNALQNPDLQSVDALILAAGLKAIPTERRPNPSPGKDKEIEMEPLTPAGSEPFTFATGRLFHEDRSVVALMLARQRLLALETRNPKPETRKALLVSNPGGSLPLLETFSRNTAKELRNAGYRTTALFGDEANKEDMRRLLPEQDIFLWEGHHKTLVEEYGLPAWTEPLHPSLVFLQSCLTLNEAEAQPLLQRGAVAVVGSATRTYAGSGGAFTLAFFDALLYEDQSLGGSLRQAKNFLLAYSLLKEKRLGEEAKLSGANLRSAWAFSLWGDPTLKLPRPAPPADALAPVRYRVRGDRIVLSLPEATYDKVTTSRYQVRMWPNARLAGLVTKGEDEEERRLVPFLFAEVHLPKAPPGKKPSLSSRLPENNWVFCWDQRRRSGYLLVIPRTKDQHELPFRVEWVE